MKILFIVPYVPSLVRVRPYSFIKFLAARGHDIHLATLWNSDAEKADLDKVKPICTQITALPIPSWRSWLNCLGAIPTSMPLQYVYCWRPRLMHEIRSCLIQTSPPGGYDVIHIEHLRGARYGMDLLRIAAKKQLPPIVWDSVDCISLLFRYTSHENKRPLTRLLTWFDLPRTEKWEAHLIRQFDRTLVTSPKDREALINLRSGAPEERLSVISNGVDLDYFSPGETSLRQPATLVMSGKMSYHANVAMAHYLVEEVLPLVWAQKPEVELTIVGKDPPASVRDLGRDPRIHVTGTVPDMRPYLQQATLAVAPLRYGVGVQNKVLEAMACQTPVITTPQVLTSLSAIPDRDLLVAETSQHFAQAILDLLNDPHRRAQIGAAGRRYVETNHTWNAIVTRLEEVYRLAIAERQRQFFAA